MRSFVYASVLGACVLTSSAQSQGNPSELRIKLNAVDGAPVSGALIALLDSWDNVVAEGLGTEDGTRTLRAGPGAYRVRVRRIGYLPFVSKAVTLPSTSDLVLDVESPRVVLQSIVVKEQFAATHCFRLVRQSDRAGQIGVALEPVPQRKLVDISGVRSARIGGRQDFGYRPRYVPIGRQENGGGILGPGEIAANQRARARTAADSLNRKQP